MQLFTCNFKQFPPLEDDWLLGMFLRDKGNPSFDQMPYSVVSDPNSVSAESIGIGAEFFFSETETFSCISAS